MLTPNPPPPRAPRQLLAGTRRLSGATARGTPAGFTLVEIMIVVVVIGMLAALALPAFQRVREASQDKAVMSNARQLSAAADQYMMEYGVTQALTVRLIGATNYVKSFGSVAQEHYPDWVTQGVTITITGVANQRTITYSP